MNIARHIADLLYLHECVIVPGLGGFISSSVPAKIDTATHEFFPPSVQVAFNASLSANDGLLANHIATFENTTYREALYDLKSWVDQGLKSMADGNTLPLDGIGSLKLNNSGQLEFEPAGLLNFNADSFGLPVFTAVPVENAAPATGKDRQTSRVGHKLNHYIPATLKWAAVLAPLVAFTLWGSFNGKIIGNYVHNYSGMYSWVRSTPGKTAPASVAKYAASTENTVAQPVAAPSSFMATAGNTLSAAAISHAQLAAKHITIETAPVQEAAVAVESAGMQYYIIGGAFRDHDNALRLLTRLKAEGYPAAIVDTTARGLFVVSISGFSTSGEALSQLRAIRNAGYQAAWILHKNRG